MNASGEETRACGRCSGLFSVDPTKGVPDIAYCPRCGETINLAITLGLHANTGRVRGNFNSLSGFTAGEERDG